MMSDQQIKQQAVIRPSFNIWRAKNGKGEVVTRCLLLVRSNLQSSILPSIAIYHHIILNAYCFSGP
jgi:hypothetical protein